MIISQSDVLCFGGATGTVVVAGSGGTVPYEYSLDGGSFQASGSFSLQAGTHILTVMDFNLCTFNIDVVIDEPASALAGAITSQTNVTCHGDANGSVEATASGGTAPYEFSLNGGAFQSAGAFSGLPGGSNTIAVRDANLCTMELPVSIAEPAEIVLSADVTDVDCPGTNQGMIVLTITGGTLPYTVSWSDGITTVSRTNITDGEYSVIVTDGNGCGERLDVTVGVIGTENCVEIPVIITPNGDGYNDTWRIKNIDLFPDAEIIVFNRWGQRVFNTKNILANPWDGTLKGKPLPVDSYHYILDFHNGSKPRSGVISIIK
jgi:gliding motility-associated-like protein